MMLNAAQMFFDYHYEVFDRVWDIVDTLSAEQFLRESEYSFRSVRNHLVHCMSGDNRWLARLQGQTPPAHFEFQDYPDRETLRTKWNNIRSAVLQYVQSLTADDLEEVLEVSFPNRGGLHRNSRWQILLHLVNHGTDHRAQIMARLHELGAATFEHDLILHLWANGEA